MAPKTWETSELALRKIQGTPLANLRMDVIIRADIENWLEGIPSDGARKRYFEYLRAELNQAVDLGIIKLNPASKIRVRVKKSTAKRLLTPSEQQALLSLEMPDRLRFFLLLCLKMGLRRGEALGLRHEDRVDDGVIIRRQVQEIRGKALVREALKTSNSFAWIPICDELLAVIGSKEGYVVSSSNGSYTRPRVIERMMDQLLVSTELEGVSPQWLRRSHGMNLLESGVDIRTSSEMMRHTPKMLLEIYAQSRTELKVDAMRKLREASQRHKIGHRETKNEGI